MDNFEKIAPTLATHADLLATRDDIKKFTRSIILWIAAVWSIAAIVVVAAVSYLLCSTWQC